MLVLTRQKENQSVSVNLCIHFDDFKQILSQASHGRSSMNCRKSAIQKTILVYFVPIT